MPRDMREVEVESHGDRGLTFKHPAFGQILVSRVSGSRHLYGSDFGHNSYMSIKICRSQMNRDLYRDWYRAREELIEVNLSEAQWATFVSSQNIGEGTPCTIAREAGVGLIPEFEPWDKTAQVKAEFSAKLDGTISNLDALAKHVQDMGLPKGKTAEILSSLRMIKQNLNANLPFVVESFSEHVEKTVEAMKSEVHGYMNGVLQRAGLDALTDGKLPVQIEGKSNAVSDEGDPQGR